MKVESQIRQLFNNLLRILLNTQYVFPMARCELVEVSLTIIIIQRITHTFYCAFRCAFDQPEVCWSHSNANANV